MNQPSASVQIREDIIDEYLSVYHEYMDLDDIHWNEKRAAWFATGRDVCFNILVKGNEFTRIDRFLPDGKAFWGQHRNLNLLGGDEHRKLHDAEMRRRSESFATDTVTPITRSIAKDILSAATESTPFELAVDYCNRLSMLTGMTYLGFDVLDTEWVEEIQKAAVVRDRWKAKLLMGLPADQDTAPGAQAIKRLRELFLPTILSRRDNPKDDLLSHMWQKGRSVFPDWDENDVIDGCWSDYIGGETPYLMRNAIYVLLRDETVRSTLQRNSALVPDFVEECLRCLSPLTMLLKTATIDVERFGVKIKEGDRLWVLPGVANIKDHRKGAQRSKGHLAFGQGTRYCTGRYVARAEVITAIRTLLESFTSITPAEGAQPPKWTGIVMRSAEPLYANLKR